MCSVTARTHAHAHIHTHRRTSLSSGPSIPLQASVWSCRSSERPAMRTTLWSSTARTTASPSPTAGPTCITLARPSPCWCPHQSTEPDGERPARPSSVCWVSVVPHVWIGWKKKSVNRHLCLLQLVRGTYSGSLGLGLCVTFHEVCFWSDVLS